MALDHPDSIARLAVLDIVPTGEALSRADARLALGYWPWSLLAQAAPLPERLIAADPEAVVDNALQGWGSEGASFPVEVRTAYVAALRDRDSVHAICEEYRAAATIDFAQDMADRKAGRRIACPLLALWGDRWPARSMVRGRGRAARHLARMGGRCHGPRDRGRAFLSRAEPRRDARGTARVPRVNAPI